MSFPYQKNNCITDGGSIQQNASLPASGEATAPRIVIRGESPSELIIWGDKLSEKPPVTPQTEYRHAFAEFLDQWPWQWFCSLTFEYSKHPESAKKSFKLWLNKLNRELYGCRAQKKGQSVYWALASEPHKSGALHYHALLGDHNNLNDSFSRRRARELWKDIAGINHIDPIDTNSERVMYYVCKYITKGGEIDLCDHLEQFKWVQLSGLEKQP